MKTIPNHIKLGHITGVHGVRGAVKLFSECRPPEQIFAYQEFLLSNEHSQETFTVTLSTGRIHGKALVAQFAGYNDRDSAYQLINHSIWVHHQQLPPLADGEFYWQELMGLEVINLEKRRLGKVSNLIETGANDVLIIKSDQRELLIPFVMGYYIIDVDKDKKILTVDWQPDWSTSNDE